MTHQCPAKTIRDTDRDMKFCNVIPYVLMTSFKKPFFEINPPRGRGKAETISGIFKF